MKKENQNQTKTKKEKEKETAPNRRDEKNRFLNLEEENLFIKLKFKTAP